MKENNEKECCEINYFLVALVTFDPYDWYRQYGEKIVTVTNIAAVTGAAPAPQWGAFSPVSQQTFVLCPKEAEQAKKRVANKN